MLKYFQHKELVRIDDRYPVKIGMTCYECKRDVATKVCEMHDPKGVRICKDCCISKVKGHKCKWFHICW
jgi:hypothetical protein